MLLYIRELENVTKKLLELRKEVGKVVAITFAYTNKAMSEKQLVRSVLFIIAQK